MILEAGTQIGDYRILSRIGKGTYGIVFEAEHLLMQRVDALKVLLDSGGSAEDEQRFIREIQVQASLKHPNIATVYHAFRTPSGLVLVMERVPGESLRAIMDRGRLPLARAIQYVLDTLAGLEYAEQAGVIHRDIKPENILITPDGGVKLTDFGLAHVINHARITGSGESLGTPMYISPEQIDGLGAVDARTDVYSTGVVLYELVTGQVPFSGTNGFAVMRAHRETMPTPPSKIEPAISERLNAVILQAMEKDPEKRFQSSAAFQAALKDASIQPAVPVPVISSKSHLVAVVAVASAAICSATVAGGYWRLRQHHVPAVHSMPAPQVKAVEPAVVMPVAETPKAAESPEAPKAAPDPISDTAPKAGAAIADPPPVKKAGRVAAKKTSAPKSLAVRIGGMDTGSAADQLSAPAPAKHSASPVFPLPTTGATCPPRPTSAENPGDEPSASKPDATTTEPKKRNAVVRAFGKIFGKKAAAAPASHQGAKPAETSAGPKQAQ